MKERRGSGNKSSAPAELAAISIADLANTVCHVAAAQCSPGIVLLLAGQIPRYGIRRHSNFSCCLSGAQPCCRNKGVSKRFCFSTLPLLEDAASPEFTKSLECDYYELSSRTMKPSASPSSTWKRLRRFRYALLLLTHGACTRPDFPNSFAHKFLLLWFLTV